MKQVPLKRTRLSTVANRIPKEDLKSRRPLALMLHFKLCSISRFILKKQKQKQTAKHIP